MRIFFDFLPLLAFFGVYVVADIYYAMGGIHPGHRNAGRLVVTQAP